MTEQARARGWQGALTRGFSCLASKDRNPKRQRGTQKRQLEGQVEKKGNRERFRGKWRAGFAQCLGKRKKEKTKRYKESGRRERNAQRGGDWSSTVPRGCAPGTAGRPPGLPRGECSPGAACSACLQTVGTRWPPGSLPLHLRSLWAECWWLFQEHQKLCYSGTWQKKGPFRIQQGNRVVEMMKPRGTDRIPSIKTRGEGREEGRNFIPLTMKKTRGPFHCLLTGHQEHHRNDENLSLFREIPHTSLVIQICAWQFSLSPAQMYQAGPPTHLLLLSPCSGDGS